MTSSPSVTCNQSELADLLRVSTKTIQQWDRDGLRDAARLKGGGRSARYDVSAAFWWYHEREVDRIRDELGSTTDEMEAAKLRKLEAEAESKELDVAVKRGELVPMDEVDVLLRGSLGSVESVLRNSSSQFAPALAKLATISVKDARVLLREILERVRGAIREADVDAA